MKYTALRKILLSGDLILYHWCTRWDQILVLRNDFSLSEGLQMTALPAGETAFQKGLLELTNDKNLHQLTISFQR